MNLFLSAFLMAWIVMLVVLGAGPVRRITSSYKSRPWDTDERSDDWWQLAGAILWPVMTPIYLIMMALVYLSFFREKRAKTR